MYDSPISKHFIYDSIIKNSLSPHSLPYKFNTIINTWKLSTYFYCNHITYFLNGRVRILWGNYKNAIQIKQILSFSDHQYLVKKILPSFFIHHLQDSIKQGHICMRFSRRTGNFFFYSHYQNQRVQEACGIPMFNKAQMVIHSALKSFRALEEQTQLTLTLLSCAWQLLCFHHY